MTKNSQDELARAYVMLLSLRKNIAEATFRFGVTETYVREFHDVLDRLKGIGLEVSEFRIPDSQVYRRVSVSSLEGDSYTPKAVDKAFMLTKLDAILGYFEIITSEKPRRIGFTKSDE